MYVSIINITKNNEACLHSFKLVIAALKQDAGDKSPGLGKEAQWLKVTVKHEQMFCYIPTKKCVNH